jgi:hypothetical protein
MKNTPSSPTIAQKCLKWVIVVKNDGKISHFNYFCAILPIRMGLKKINHENG